MKIFKLALSRACLLVFALVLACLTSAIAADNTSDPVGNYRSSFDDYKPLADESLDDWKATNAQSSGSGHAGHSRKDMDHTMSSEQMANMPKEDAADKDMPDMEGMDHSQMPRGAAEPTMQGMNHDEMKPMPDKKDSSMQEMNPSQIQKMDYGKRNEHYHEMPAAMDMDHENMTDTQRSHETHDEAMPEKAPHQDHEQGHHPAKLPMAAEATPQSQDLQIIPNFHPLVVHFPIALTLAAFLLSLIAYVRKSHTTAAQLAAAGHLTLWLAALGATIAVLFGWLAFNSVNHDDAGHAAMLLHRSWAIPTAIGLVLLAAWDAWKYRINQVISIPAILLLAVLSSAVAVTAWLGGEVVYRHGIGVLTLPTNEGGHHNEHGSPNHSDGASKPESDGNVEQRHVNEKGDSHEH